MKNNRISIDYPFLIEIPGPMASLGQIQVAVEKYFEYL
jgi:hypothetical protein